MTGRPFKRKELLAILTDDGAYTAAMIADFEPNPEKRALLRRSLSKLSQSFPNHDQIVTYKGQARHAWYGWRWKERVFRHQS